MYIINFVVLLSIVSALPLAAGPNKAMKICRDFNNSCDVMSCAMSPLSGEVIDTFERNFDQLEREVLAGIDRDLPRNR